MRDDRGGGPGARLSSGQFRLLLFVGCGFLSLGPLIATVQWASHDLIGTVRETYYDPGGGKYIVIVFADGHRGKNSYLEEDLRPGDTIVKRSGSLAYQLNGVRRQWRPMWLVGLAAFCLTGLTTAGVLEFRARRQRRKTRPVL